MPAEEEGPVHEVLIKCEEVVKEETVETENERRKWEETQYFATDRNSKIVYKSNSTRWGAQQRKI